MWVRPAPTRRLTAAGLGKIPTTRERRLISLLIRSSGFVDQVSAGAPCGEGGEREDLCYGIVITDPIFGNDAHGGRDLVPGREDRAWIGLGGDHAEHAGDHVRGGELLLACQPVDPVRHALAWARQWRLRCPADGRAGGLVSTVVNGPLARGKHVSLMVIGVRLVRVCLMRRRDRELQRAVDCDPFRRSRHSRLRADLSLLPREAPL
jgi:hypothetical protein